MTTVITHSAEATKSLGERLSALLRGGDVVLLIGGLGAGKTTLVQGIAHGLGYRGEVTSPTFTLCHTYTGRTNLVHADLWRLETVSEILDLALEEELEEGAILVAEWGEGAEALFANRALVVHIDSSRGAGEAEQRRLTFELPPSWSDRAGPISRLGDSGSS